MMQPVIIGASAAFGGALLALLVYHLAFVAPALRRAQQALAQHDDLLGGGAPGAIARFAALENAHAALAGRTERAESRLRELDSLARTDVSRIGFVRYDAFDDTGSELSYAFALLNREGDGIVLTSIYSRADSRTFGKAVERFVPLAAASPEELEAISRARGDGALLQK